MQHLPASQLKSSCEVNSLNPWGNCPKCLKNPNTHALKVYILRVNQEATVSTNTSLGVVFVCECIYSPSVLLGYNLLVHVSFFGGWNYTDRPSSMARVIITPDTWGPCSGQRTIALHAHLCLVLSWKPTRVPPTSPLPIGRRLQLNSPWPRRQGAQPRPTPALLFSRVTSFLENIFVLLCRERISELSYEVFYQYW